MHPQNQSSTVDSTSNRNRKWREQGEGWGFPPEKGMRVPYPNPRSDICMRGADFYPPPNRFNIPPHPNFYNQVSPPPYRYNPRPQYPFNGFTPRCKRQPQQPPEEQPSEVPPPKKKKSTANDTSQSWNREAAEKALAVEAEYQKNAGSNAIIIRFPDPELSKEIVQKFHPAIKNVHFQAPCSARYCFVTLTEDSNVDKVMADIGKIKFGVGHLVAERKVQKTEDNVKPENIDPFTLYVGNLPNSIRSSEIKKKFLTATRIDMGYAQKMIHTRYAFVRYSTSEAALEAYKASVNTVIDSRSIILRFRRHKAPVGPPGEKPAPSIIEAKPGEKLTIGDKMKAKEAKEKQEATKAKKSERKPKKMENKVDTKEGSSDLEEEDLETEDTDQEDTTEKVVEVKEDEPYYEEDEDDEEDEDGEEDEGDDTDDEEDKGEDDETDYYCANDADVDTPFGSMVADFFEGIKNQYPFF